MGRHPPSTAATGVSRTSTATGATPLPPAVLPRGILRWLQSLQLSVPVGRVPRTELSNGYVVAEILQRYRVPEGFQEIYLPSFENGAALDTKLNNWSRLKTILAKNHCNVSPDVIDATIHCKRGAAEHFLLLLYTHLTSNKTPDGLQEHPDFSDTTYQMSLPYYARPTAASLIKSNIRSLEERTKPDEDEKTARIHNIVASHTDRDQDDREHNPARYNRRPLDERGLPTRAVPLDPDVKDVTQMHRTAQFVVQTARQRPLAPIDTPGSSARSSATATTRRPGSAAGAVGPVGHTTMRKEGLNVTQRLEDVDHQ